MRRILALLIAPIFLLSLNANAFLIADIYEVPEPILLLLLGLELFAIGFLHNRKMRQLDSQLISNAK